MKKKNTKKPTRNRNSDNFGEVERALVDLGTRLEAAELPTFQHPYQQELMECGEPPEWRGGGVIVTSDFEWQPQGFSDRSKLQVRTRHAVQLTWLMLEIRDVFSPWVYFSNKFGFYGSLAEAALNYLAANQPEIDDPRPLLRAVLSRSFAWLQVLREQGHIPDNPECVLHLEDLEGRQKRIDLRTREESF